MPLHAARYALRYCLPGHTTPVSPTRLTIAFLAVLVGLGVTAGCAGARGHKRHTGAPRPAAGVATHVDTWALDDGCNGGVGAGAALVRSWLTYAESNCGP